MLGIDPARLSQYETGARMPGRLRAIRIAENTGGLVPVESWDTRVAISRKCATRGAARRP